MLGLHGERLHQRMQRKVGSILSCKLLVQACVLTEPDYLVAPGVSHALAAHLTGKNPK